MRQDAATTPLGARLAAESRALLALLWIGYSRAEAEEAVSALAPSLQAPALPGMPQPESDCASRAPRQVAADPR